MHVIVSNLPASAPGFSWCRWAAIVARHGLPGRDRGMPDAGRWRVTMTSVPAIGVETLNRYPSAALSTSGSG